MPKTILDGQISRGQKGGEAAVAVNTASEEPLSQYSQRKLVRHNWRSEVNHTEVLVAPTRYRQSNIATELPDLIPACITTPSGPAFTGDDAAEIQHRKRVRM